MRPGRVEAQEVFDFGATFLIGEHNSLFLRVFLLSLGQDHRKIICDVMKVKTNNVCLRCVSKVELQIETSHISGI